jgi:hypothetical protein
MTEHSPLPWTADPDDRPGYDWNIHILDAKGNRVCFMTSDGPSEENAALIVRSVNLLPEALAALERIAAHDGGYVGNIASDVLQKARQP